MIQFDSKQPIEIVTNKRGEPVLLGQALLVMWTADPRATEEDKRLAAMELEAKVRCTAQEKKVDTIYLEVPEHYNGPLDVQIIRVVKQTLTPSSLASAASGVVVDNHTPASKYLN
jgi:hypothetical protein